MRALCRFLVLLALSRKIVCQKSIPNVWYTLENITEDIKHGITYLDPGLSGRNAMRSSIVPPISKKGFRIISTPPQLQAILVADLDECCQKDVRIQTNEACGTKETTANVAEWAINTHNGKDRRTRLCRPPDANIKILEDSFQAIFEEWIGDSVTMAMTYGTRIYFQNATLRMHVDKIETHVISAIINVAQDTEEEWPISILDHDGAPHNLVLAPGQSLLYESARLVHGRPIVFRGRNYANIFVHSYPHYWPDYVQRTNLLATEDTLADAWAERHRKRIYEERTGSKVERFVVQFVSKHHRDLEFFWLDAPDRISLLASDESILQNVDEGHVFVFRVPGSTVTFQRIEIKGGTITAWRRAMGPEAPFVYTVQATPVSVQIHNELHESIDIWWRKPETREVILQGSVLPGAVMHQQTFAGHRFCGTRLAANADPDPNVVHEMDDVIVEFTVETPRAGTPQVDLFVRSAVPSVYTTTSSTGPQSVSHGDILLGGKHTGL